MNTLSVKQQHAVAGAGYYQPTYFFFPETAAVVFYDGYTYNNVSEVSYYPQYNCYSWAAKNPTVTTTWVYETPCVDEVVIYI